jgi:hypothetical protein
MDHGAPDDDGDNGVPDLRRFFSTGLPLPWGPSSSAVVVSAVVTAVETTGTLDPHYELNGTIPDNPERRHI